MALPDRLSIHRGPFVPNFILDTPLNLVAPQTAQRVRYFAGNIVTMGERTYMCTVEDTALHDGRGATEAPTATNTTQWLEITGDIFSLGHLSSFRLVNPDLTPAMAAEIDVNGTDVNLIWGTAPAVSATSVYVARTFNNPENQGVRNDLLYIFRGSDVTRTSTLWDLPSAMHFPAIKGSAAFADGDSCFIYEIPNTDVLNPIISGIVERNLPSTAPDLTQYAKSIEFAGLRGSEVVEHDVVVNAFDTVAFYGPTRFRAFRNITATPHSISNGSTEETVLNNILTNTLNFVEIPTGGDTTLTSETTPDFLAQDIHFDLLETPTTTNALSIPQFGVVELQHPIVGLRTFQNIMSTRQTIAAGLNLTEVLAILEVTNVWREIPVIERGSVTTRWDPRVTDYDVGDTVVLRTTSGLEQSFLRSTDRPTFNPTGVLPVAATSAADPQVTSMAPAWNLRTGRVYFDYELVTNEGGVYFANPGEQTIRSTSVAPTTSANDGWTQVTLASGSNNVWSQLNVASGTISVQNNGTGLPTSADTLNFGEGITASNGTSTKLIAWDGLAVQDGTATQGTTDNVRGNARTLRFGDNLTINDVEGGLGIVNAANTNTTYTFGDGTTPNTFDVTPSGTNLQTVVVPPGIPTSDMFPTDTTTLILNQYFTIPMDVTIDGTAFVAGIYELTQITPTVVWTLRARRNPVSADGVISSVGAGAGLTSAGTATDPVLNVGMGTGITVSADSIAVTNPFEQADEDKLDAIADRATRGVTAINQANTATQNIGTLTAGDGIELTSQPGAGATDNGTTVISSTGTRHTITTGGSDSTAGTNRIADTIHFFTSPNDNPITGIGTVGGASEIQVGIPANTDTLVSRVEFDTNALRNAQVRRWRPSDLAIVGTGNSIVEYLFVGDLSTARATTDADWQEVGGGTTGSETLAGLTDVTIPTPTEGQVLTYDDTNDVWVNRTPTGGGITTREIQVFRSITGSTNNDVAGGSVTITLQMPETYTSLITNPDTFVDSGVNQSGSNGAGFFRVTNFAALETAITNAGGFPIRIATDAAGTNERTLTGTSSDFFIFTGAAIPANSDIFLFQAGTMAVATYEVNLNNIANPSDLTGPLGTVASPITSGVAALTIIRDALRVRYPSFTIGLPADLSGTATLQIATDLASLDGGAVDFSISNLMAGDNGTRMSVDTPAQGALSMYTITPPGGSAIIFSALDNESLTSLLDRIVNRIAFGDDTTTWEARRDNNELHLTSTTTTPVTGLWTIVADHGGSPPANRINFGVAVETQVAGQTVTGFDSTLTVNADNQLGVSPDSSAQLDNTGHLIEVDDSTAALVNIYNTTSFFNRANPTRVALYNPASNELTLGLATLTFTNGMLQGGDYIRIGTHRARVNRAGGLFQPAGTFDANVTPDPNFRSYLLTAGAPYANSSVRNYTGSQLVDEGTAVVHRFSSRQGSATPIVYNSITNRIQTANTFIENSRPTLGEIRAGDIWINTAPEIIVEGTGFGTFVDGNLRRPNGNVIGGLRDVGDTTDANNSVLDVGNYHQPSNAIGANTAPLDNGTYILINANGKPSTRAFSLSRFIETRVRLGSVGETTIRFEHLAVINGVPAIITDRTTRSNPENVAVDVLGLGLEDTYNSSLYRVSAGGTVQNQPVTYTPAQVRVYAKGLHTRNAANTGWVSEVTGYEQLD